MASRGKYSFLSLLWLLANSLDSYFCEGRIITTIFGLLCWDIIFAPIDGAFETPYQVAPLDIAEDTFFYSRQDIAKTRLKQLAVADNATIMEMMDEAYTTHEKKRCVGVQWEMFEKEHLKEIAAVCAFSVPYTKVLTVLIHRSVYRRCRFGRYMSDVVRRL